MAILVTDIMFYSVGEFYGHNAATTNLELLSRFYAKYPEYAEKTFLSVKVLFWPSIAHTQYATLTLTTRGASKPTVSFPMDRQQLTTTVK